MKLIPDWKSAWRWYSVWIAGALAAIPSAWASLPPELKAYIPEAWMPYVAAGMFVAFVFARILNQKK